jgi:acyl carrier protein
MMPETLQGEAGMRDSLLQCIKEGLEEVNTTREEKIPTDALEELRFYGDGGVFDSMQLVSFLMVVEEKMADQLGIVLSIVSEKAVSRKVSPFSNVSTLVDYLLEEIGEARESAA